MGHYANRNSSPFLRCHMTRGRSAQYVNGKIVKTPSLAGCVLCVTRRVPYDRLSRPGEVPSRFLVCGSHRVLDDIYRSKGEKEKATHHFETALGIALTSNWHHELSLIHLSLPGRDCFSTNVGSVMPTATSNKQSRTSSMEHTAWVVRWSCKQSYGLNKAD